MKAIRVTRHGGPERLHVVDIDIPTPGRGQALVRIAASGVNYIDIYQRSGYYPTELPFVPGHRGVPVPSRHWARIAPISMALPSAAG